MTGGGRTTLGDRPAARLRVEPSACAGIGVCAHLAPRLVELDRWGYPIVTAHALTDSDHRSAARAARACPRAALWIEVER